MEKVNTRLLAIDIETTGLDFQKHKITEIGWVIKDYKMPKHVAAKSFFVKEPTQNTFTITKEITGLTGITEGMWRAYAVNLADVVGDLIRDISFYGVDYIIGHNVLEFDWPFLRQKCNGFEIDINAIHNCKWLDSRYDIDYPSTFGSRSLISICAHLGFINPFPHSSLFDSAACLKIVDHYDLPSIIERGNSPWVVLEAIVTFDDRQKAKDAKYYWERCGTLHYPKKWIKRVKEIDIPAETSLAEDIGFTFSVMK